MEKLDVIIAALQRVELLFESHGQYPHTLREVNEALTAARDLQALKPVARVILTETIGMPIMQWIDLDRSFKLDSGALLYALGEAT